MTDAALSEDLKPAIVFCVEEPGQGGTELYVERLARYCAARHRTAIATMRGTDDARRARFGDTPGFAFGDGASLADALDWLGDGGIVHANLYRSLLPFTLKLRKRRPLIATFHSPLRDWNWPRQQAWKIAAALSDAVVGVSDHCLDGLGAISRSKARGAIPGPLDLASMPPAPIAPARPAGIDRPLRIVGCGRLAREKDWPTLIRAMEGRSDMRLAIYGDGPLRNTLAALATDLGVPLELPGHVTPARLHRALGEADIAVLPSLYEGFGMAAIEAMAMGAVSVTADFPASSNYIAEGETGFTFPRQNSRALGLVLERLRDPALRARVAAQGAQFARSRFTEQRQFGRYIDLYDRLAAGDAA